MNTIVTCACGKKYNAPQNAGNFVCSGCGSILSSAPPLGSNHHAQNPLTPNRKKRDANFALKIGAIVGLLVLLVVGVIVLIAIQIGSGKGEQTADQDIPSNSGQKDSKEAPHSSSLPTTNDQFSRSTLQGQGNLISNDLPIHAPNLPLVAVAADVDITQGQWNIGYLRQQVRARTLYNSNRLIMISMQKCSAADLSMFRDALNVREWRPAAALALLNWKQDVSKMIDIVVEGLAVAFQNPSFKPSRILSTSQYHVQIFDAYGVELKAKWIGYLNSRNAGVQLIGIYQLGRLGNDAKDCVKRLEQFTQGASRTPNRSGSQSNSNTQLAQAAKLAINQINNPAIIEREKPPSAFAKQVSSRNKRIRANGWQTYESPCNTYSIQIPDSDSPPFAVTEGSRMELRFSDSMFEVNVQTLGDEDKVESWKATSIQLGDRLSEEKSIASPVKLGVVRKFYIDNTPRAECMHLSSKNVYIFNWTGAKGGGFTPEIDKFFSSFKYVSEFDAKKNYEEFVRKKQGR